MKNVLLFLIALLCVFSASGQVPQYTNTVFQTGLDHCVRQCVTLKTNLLNEVQVVTNSYVELATGMNKWENNQFVPCNPVIELQANGATATGTRHQILF